MLRWLAKCSPAAADRFCNAVENRPPRFAHSLTARAADFQQTVMCVWEKIDPQSEIAAADIYCVKGPALSVLKMEKPICGIKVASEDYYINVDLMKDYPIHFGGESKPMLRLQLGLMDKKSFSLCEILDIPLIARHCSETKLVAAFGCYNNCRLSTAAIL
jgi:hypothetical protein